MAMPEGAVEREALNSHALMKRLDIQSKAFLAYCRSGMPHLPCRPGVEPHYDPVAVRAWMEENGLSGERGQQGFAKQADPAVRELLFQARLRKELALAAKHEHQVAVARGATISLGAYQQESLAKIAAVKAGLLALPGKVASRLVGLSAREIQVEMEREVRDLLAEFAQRVVGSLTEASTDAPKIEQNGPQQTTTVAAPTPATPLMDVTGGLT